LANAGPGHASPGNNHPGLANPGTSAGTGTSTGTSGVGFPVMADAHTNHAGTRTDRKLAAGQSTSDSSAGRTRLELPGANSSRHDAFLANPGR